jgi:hypothetical protein
MTVMTASFDKLFTTEQLMRYLEIGSRNTIQKYREEFGLPHRVMPDGSFRYRKGDVDQWYEDLPAIKRKARKRRVKS